jgi:Ca2+-binding EF-hand superfamily protein
MTGPETGRYPMADAQEAARAEFTRFDADGDGLLTADEIRKANHALGGQGATEAEIEAFISAADRDGDGRIGLEEFAALVGGGRHEKA